MKDGKPYKVIPLVSLTILTAVFCLFVIGFEKYSVNQAEARLEKHALVVADSLWNFNSAGIVEYLRLAAEADHYATLEIVNKDGNIFQAVGTSPPSGLERLLLAAHLIPKVELVSQVWSKTDLLGWVKAVWIPTTIPIYVTMFVFLLMVHLVVVLYCRILKQKLLLEQRVAERTFELSQANNALKREIHERTLAEKERGELQCSLERSKKMESLGLLAGGVAHDLNNVLSGIVSYPDLLLHDMPEDNPMRRVILTIRDSGMRAAEIVQDLLTLARRGVVTRKMVNLNNLIDEYCNSPEYRKLLDVSANLEMELQLDPNLATVTGSPVALKKVLMNLVANGAEAQPHGGRIRIATQNVILAAPLEGFQRIGPGEFVVLTVADEGEGIAQDDRQRIFEPFYTKKVMGRSGTGLGLTVVWGTVEDHGGAIDIDSELGLGTTISVYLPVGRDPHQPGPDEPDVHRDLLGHRETILVVDDVLYQREIACAMLKRLNYTPLAVESGEAAISLVQTKEIDLMILDMIMDGGIDGLETYRGVQDFRPGQKAVVVSGFSETDRVHEAQRLGAGVCLKKPYTFDELALAVKQELQKVRHYS